MFHVKVYPVSVLPHHRGHTMPVLSVCVRTYVCLQGRAWQQHIWLLTGPWSCNSDLEVLRCLFIAMSLGAWPYSPWHFQPLICRRTVMEYLSGVTLCSCHTIFWMAQRSCNPCGGDAAVGWNLALIQWAAVGGCCWVIDIFRHINRIWPNADWAIVATASWFIVIWLWLVLV